MNRTLAEEKDSIDKALDEFTNDMRARLYEMAEKGKRGWDDPRLETEIVRDMYIDAGNAFDYGQRIKLHDIATRAMMLWWQKWRAK